MSVPVDAVVFDEAMGPFDAVEWVTFITQDDKSDPPATLMPGEAIASFTVAPSVEAMAAGMQIRSDGIFAPRLVDLKLTFWPVIAPAQQLSPLFNGGGTLLGVEITIKTNSTPPRTKLRTVVLKVRQR